MPISCHGRASRSSSAGMTLIELMVGMTIIGIILSIAVVGIRNLSDTEMKTASSRLASTIRYLYNKSATERLYLRLVYNLEDQSYHVESTSEPFLISPPDPDAKEPPAEEAAAEEVAEGGAAEEGEEGEVAVAPSAEGFSPTESYLLKPVKLAGDVYFKDIHVSYVKGPIGSGLAYTYFFPNGFATPTVVNLRDEDDVANFSLMVSPLSGRVKIESEYRALVPQEE